MITFRQYEPIVDQPNAHNVQSLAWVYTIWANLWSPCVGLHDPVMQQISSKVIVEVKP